MQIYAARPEKGKWGRHVLTEWERPVEFGGRGSMGFIGIGISGFSQIMPDLLTMTFQHRDYGTGRLFVDEETLQPKDLNLEIAPKYPNELNQVQSGFPGMQINRCEDIGDSGDESVRYLLQWETLGSNQDKPRQSPLPEPDVLRLYKLILSEQE